MKTIQIKKKFAYLIKFQINYSDDNFEDTHNLLSLNMLLFLLMIIFFILL